MKTQSSALTHPRLVGALSYIGILFFIPLFFHKESAFAQFHAKQGFALFLLEILAIILALTFILWWVALVLYTFCIIAAVYGIWTAAHGNKRRIPLVTRVIEMLNI